MVHWLPVGPFQSAQAHLQSPEWVRVPLSQELFLLLIMYQIKSSKQELKNYREKNVDGGMY